MKFDKNLLIECLIKDQSLLINIQLPLNRDSIITYECRCKNIFKKCFRELSKIDGAICKTCKFKERSLNIHNFLYNYDKVKFIKNTEKVIIICNLHGEFLQSPKAHLEGQGCPHSGCKNFKMSQSKLKTLEYFIEKANIVHNNFYDYSKSIYIDSYSLILINCKIHGEFEQKAVDHLVGKKCSKCSNVYRRNTLEFIEEANIKHKNKYDYSITNFTGSLNKVNIICKIHGLFSQIAISHLKGHGCSKCTTNYSKSSIEWLNYIAFSENKIIIHAENDGEYLITGTRYKADGYCKKTNTVYEYLGDYYHGNPKKYILTDINKKIGCTFNVLYNKTINRCKIIKELGYNYIQIWEYDWRLAIKWIIKIQKLWKKYKIEIN